jgi:hypothetical protein
MSRSVFSALSVPVRAGSLSQNAPASSPPRIRTYRRSRRAHIGELWLHDSSIHQWWPAAQKQILLLTVDDHSGIAVAGRFVIADTTWNHFCLFRAAFENHGIPEAIYTDALSLFGPSSSSDRSDPRSEFQRALRALGVTHLVAPTPQAKGKIERRFGTFKRFHPARALLDLHLSQRQQCRVNNDRTVDIEGRN